MFRGLFHYVDRSSVVHKLDPRVKLLMLIPVSLLTIASIRLVTLSLIFSFVIGLYVLSRIPYRRYKAIATVCVVSSVSLIFFGAFFYFGFYHHPERQLTIWFWIFRPEDLKAVPVLGGIILALTGGQGMVLAQEGVLWGIVTTLKFSIALFAGNWVIMTTKPKEILLALNRMGIPLKLTFVAITALRFIPVVMEEWYVTMNAQKSRGLKFKTWDIKGVAQSLTSILSTLVINSIRRARILALAMETRAFGANKKKVSFKKIEMTRLDKFLTVTICVATVAILIFTLLYPYHTGYTL